jgi:predicted transcriptional regulator
MFNSVKDAVEFFYNFIESLSILERNRDDNYFATKGFTPIPNETNKNLDNLTNLKENIMLQKTKEN